jgi:hypothetical protein
MHYIVYINYPFNGLLLLLLVWVAHSGRRDVPFNEEGFIMTFFLSVALVTFTGALLDGMLMYHRWEVLLVIAATVGLIAGSVCIRYLAFSQVQGLVGMILFTSLNVLVWAFFFTTDMTIDDIRSDRIVVPAFYLLLISLTIVYTHFRLTRSSVVLIHPYTGDRGLERVDHAPGWDQAKDALTRRVLTELLALCVITGAVTVLIPLVSSSSF